MEAFIGEIRMVGFNFAPQNWTECNGQLMAIQTNTPLFALLGTTYGGDGRTTFGIPDLRGRVPLGNGRGLGLPEYQLGHKGGSPTNQLSVSQLPSHDHQLSTTKAKLEAGDTEVIVAGGQGNSSTGYTGGSQEINNMQPFQTIKYIICLSGAFPPRN